MKKTAIYLIISLILLSGCSLTKRIISPPQEPTFEDIARMLEESGANKVRAYKENHGGAPGSLDETSCLSLSTNDVAMVPDLNSETMHFYRYDSTATDPEDTVLYSIVEPDDVDANCSGNGNWIAIKGLSLGPTTNPQSAYYDSDATDLDKIVYWSIDCDSTGTGAEDCKISLYLHRNGASTQTINIGGTTQNFITLYETIANGDNKVLISAPASLSSNPIATLPSVTGTLAVTDADQDVWQCFTVKSTAFRVDGTNCTSAEAVAMGGTGNYPTNYAVDCGTDAAGTMQFSVDMPENWDGGSIRIALSAFSDEASPAGTIEFDTSIYSVGNDETMDNITWVTTNGEIYFEDAETSNTTIDTQYDRFKTWNEGNMAASGAGGDELFVLLTRDNDDATHDTSTQGVWIISAQLCYQIDDMHEMD